LRDAFAVLRTLTRQALEVARGQPIAQREILDAARIQTNYILLQCVKRGSGSVRLRSFARLVAGVFTGTSRARRFLGRAVRESLLGKVRPA
jgi:hypothetical protein